MPKFVWLVMCTAITAAAWSTFAATDGDAQPKAAPVFAGSPVASCASAGCHGGGNVGRVGSEQSMWATADPHARAYRVLFNEESLRITKSLRQGDPNRPDAHRDASCLACHTSGANACFDGTTLTNATDGVGCDACHGASASWLTKHYEPGWKSLSSEAKFHKYGFQPTKNLFARIGTCVGCHVGDATREVTHELIAAGHPRLAFEAARYHFTTNYTKHWAESLPSRSFEIRTWAIGQIVAAKASIDLLHVRVSRSNDVRSELAEQSCIACHKGLGAAARTNASRGRPDWQPWYLAVLPVVASEAPALFPGISSPDLEPVRLLVAEMRNENPNAERVSTLSRQSSLMLKDWMSDLRWETQSDSHLTPERLRQLTIAIGRSAEAESEWDRVAPHYLALAAIRHADGTAVPEWDATLAKLKDRINYPMGTNSPKRYDAAEVRELFRDLLRRAER